ncbi:hypothetical protein FNF28_01832 [Cafeteria roenbergensis]|uniref:Uncharacterized protein n=1 Tax=Cafeteria roenbergensis TaxID=33653 RepID=A0A5A8DWM7_CAFRO|nr:hypothetical protein FNF28_01832 [Cafeteria roenbergensis]
MAEDKAYKPLPKGTWPVTMGKKDRMAWGIQTGPTSRSLVTTVRIDGPAVAKSIQVAGTIGPFGSAHAQLKGFSGDYVVVLTDKEEEYSNKGMLVSFTQEGSDALEEIGRQRDAAKAAEAAAKAAAEAEAAGGGAASAGAGGSDGAGLAAAAGLAAEAEQEEPPLPDEDESLIVMEEPIQARRRAPEDGADTADAVRAAVGGPTRPLIRVRNETLDVFGEDPVRTVTAAGGEGSTAALLLGAQGDSAFRETRTVTDLTLSTGRAIDVLSWHPTLPLVLAATPVPASAGFDARVGMSGQSQKWYVLVFTLTDFGAQIALQSPYEVTSLAWNPWDQGIIAAGTWSGQVVLWDLAAAMAALVHRRGGRGGRGKGGAAGASLRAAASSHAGSAAAAGGAAGSGSAKDASGGASAEAAASSRSGTVHLLPTSVSHADKSHSRPVRDLQWLPPSAHLAPRLDSFVTGDNVPRKSCQFVSAASDGTVRVWDTRYRERAKARAGGRAAPSDPSGVAGGLLPGAAALAAAKEPEVEWAPVFVAEALEGAHRLCLSRVVVDPVDAARPLMVSTEEGLLGSVDWCPPGLGVGGGLATEVEAKAGPAASRRAILASGTADVVDEETAKGAAMAAEAAKDAVDPRSSGGDADEGAGAGASAGGSRVGLLLPDLGRPPLAFERSPVLTDLILAVGETVFSVWRVGLRHPLFVSPPASARLTCGCFSPTRPAVVFLGRSDGLVDAWDLSDTTLRPVLSAPVVSTAVACMQFQFRGLTPTKRSTLAAPLASTDESAVTERARQLVQPPAHLLGVGDEKGNIHVLEVPSALATVSERDYTGALAFVHRETNRVLYASARVAMRGVLSDVTKQRAEAQKAAKEKAEADEEAELDAVRQSMEGDDASDPDRVALARKQRRIAKTEQSFASLRLALCEQLGVPVEALGYGPKGAPAAPAAAAAGAAAAAAAASAAPSGQHTPRAELESKTDG